MNKYDDEYIKKYQKEVYDMKKTQKEVVQQLDIGKYVTDIEQQIAKGFRGTITDVTQVSSNEFFKDTTGKYDDRNGVAVTVVTEGEQTQEFKQWFSLPNLRGWEQSNLYAFKKKYGSVPLKGQGVECVIDENGFFRIKV